MSANSPSCFVSTIDLSLAKKLQEDLLAQGFEITTPPHTLFQGKKKGITCTLYQSGKLTVQGSEKSEFIAFYLEPEILKNLSYTHPHAHADLTPRIGVDEAGKGDFFGPLCIASFYADQMGIETLIKMGVRDSKKMSDKSIISLASQLKSFPHHIVLISPRKYNELYEKFHNLNSLLAWGHATVIENLSQKTACKHVIIDQFASEYVVENALRQKKLELHLTQRHRGEEDVVVAAASILARASFVEGLDRLGEKIGFKLPKGASQEVIVQGKLLVAKFGKEILNEVAKLHFKTKNEILL